MDLAPIYLVMRIIHKDSYVVAIETNVIVTRIDTDIMSILQ